ncbi:MAG: shikimate dehydrogenase [Spirochaetaceae bacterium]|nr:shikimate dehydrogenase [Spirochaetaceae bacterium]
MIFLVLSGKTLEENFASLKKYRPHIDGAELRADFLQDPRAEDWNGFFRAESLPLILTLRKPEDGGHFRGNETSRRDLFLRLIEEGDFRYIDLEKNAEFPDVEEAARGQGMRIIRSFHDFTGVPEDLTNRVLGLARSPDEIPKAAVMPRSCRDLERILDTFSALRGRQKILIGMGEFGFVTRVLAPRLGSFLSFACPAENAVAPGLIAPEILDTVYRYHNQTADTRVFGIIGNPILHSRSPSLHNAEYARQEMDAVFAPFHTDRVEDFLPIARKLNMEGFSITAPFKEEVMKFCGRREDAAEAIGACNTAVFRDGSLCAYNTDAEGFLAPLRPLFAEKVPAGAAVIGAGGAARAAVYALAREGMRVLVLNRTREKAARLCAELSGALGLPPGRLSPAGRDEEGFTLLEEHSSLIVNATTLGMHPWEDAAPLEERDFRGHELVYDMVYFPRETRFIKRALAAGCRVIYGEQMLSGQARRQFCLFTGKKSEGI